jgi:Tfp pilus assembly protein FimV
MTAVVWMAVLAAFIVAVGVLPAAGDPVPSRSTATIAVRVSPADTLWTIAAANRLPGLTTAQMVRVIREANALSDGALGAGTVLRVPAARSDAGTAYAQAVDSPAAH